MQRCKNSFKEVTGEIRSYKTSSRKIASIRGSIDLLLGTDFADAFVDVHVIPGHPGKPVAKMNCFGWYVLGQLATSNSTIQSVNVETVSVAEDLNILLQQDLIGVKPTELCTCSDNELRENKFVKSLSESTRLVDGRVQIKMPWKEDDPPKRSNHDIALKRMHATERSFQKKDFTKAVDEEVQKLVSQGFVMKVPSEEVYHMQPEWYLPLQAVFTPDKTTKLRLVFDSSAKGHDDRSLNDHLEKGPNYINELPGVLAAWRWDNVAYSGDVRKMFNQILVHPDDQVFHRFLWRSSLTEEPTVYQWLRLSFGDKPAPDIASNSINFLAKASQVDEPEAATELLRHVYVVDVGGSCSTIQDAKRVTTRIDAILENRKFEIKAWHSNRKEIDQTQNERFTDLLGHKWDKELDKFTLKKAEVTRKFEAFTKRSCLATDCLARFNPADGLTRGIELEQLEEWLTGPHFLKTPEREWPQFEEGDQKPDVDLSETRRESKPLKKSKTKPASQVSSTFKEQLPSSTPEDSAVADEPTVHANIATKDVSH